MKHLASSALLLIAITGFLSSSLARLAQAQEETGRTDVETFDQLKVEGAARSAFLKAKAIASDEQPEPNLKSFESDVRPILLRSCVACHGDSEQEGNVRIDTLDPDLLHGDDVNWWTEILAVLSNGEMPPPDDVQMTAVDRSKVIDWLSDEIQLASKVRRAEGGHSSFRRMTRYEYNYTLQDILGLPFDFARDLPPESSSEDGFANSSELLHMSVGQLESYRRLARKALQRATVVGEQPSALHWGVTMKMAADKEWAKQEAKVNKLKNDLKDEPDKLEKELERLDAKSKKTIRGPHFKQLSTGRMAPANWAYHGAKYAFEPSETRPQLPDDFDHIAILPRGRNNRLVVELGNQLPDEGILRVKVRASRVSSEPSEFPSLRVDFGWRASNEGRAVIRVFDKDTEITAGPDKPEIYQWDIPLGEVYPRNSMRNVTEMGAQPSPSEYIQLVNSSVTQGPIQIDYVEVSTPVFEQWPPASHRQIFFDSKNKADEDAYAREVLAKFMKRAWRREISALEIDRKLQLYKTVRASCETMEDAMVETLAAVLSSPNMLYLVSNAGDEDSADRFAQESSNESNADIESAGKRNRLTTSRPKISSLELATRLSMFLWSSVPDAELLELGINGQLTEPNILETQVSRMLADSRANRMPKYFVKQWLGMDLLEFLTIDNKKFPGFAPELKAAMQAEPVAFFNELLNSDQSVLNFIHADFALVNERLAKHYRLNGVSGNNFRRVDLGPGNRRGGLLTQAGLLAMNSDGSDSHPLKRGIWLLESLLNDPPPPPPPNVPEIDLADPAIAKMTLKERIEDHRNHEACMSCHAKIDPWGIAFENFDAIGRWRQKIGDKPVDSNSVLFNDQELAGIDGLKRYLLKHRQDQFVQAMVHKMATYALGRPLTFADRSSINEITTTVRKQGDGLATMIKAIIVSDLFQTE